MADLFSNYWVGLLVLGPIAGVLWTLLIGRAQQDRVCGAEYIVEGNNGQVVIGNNNRSKQIKDSYNKTTVNNYHGNKNKGEDDPMALGIVIVGGAILIAAILAWGMAKYGALIVSLELALVTTFAICLVSHLIYKFYTGEYENLEFPLSLVLVATILVGFFATNNLNNFMRDDVAEMVLGYQNVVEFFFDLSSYGKTLLISQAICAIFIILNQIYIVARAYGLQRGHCNWYLDLFLIFPVFGLLPLWLSHPDWGVRFIVERLA